MTDQPERKAVTAEGWIKDAAREITRHVKTARSPAFQSTAEYKIEEAHKSGCAAERAAIERCLLAASKIEFGELPAMSTYEALVIAVTAQIQVAIRALLGGEEPDDDR